MKSTETESPHRVFASGKFKAKKLAWTKEEHIESRKDGL